MSITTQKLSFAEYLTYQGGTDRRYELVEGDLVPMSLGTGRHGSIIRYLVHQFEAAIRHLDQPWIVLPGLVGIRSPRGRRWDTVRIPDITLLTAELWESMADREAVIDLNQPPPLLVVEVISPSTRIDDTRSKRAEYGLLDIPEYWIVDPIDSQITRCQLEHQLYDSTDYRGQQQILSPPFPSLELTVDQILAAKL